LILELFQEKEKLLSGGDVLGSNDPPAWPKMRSKEINDPFGWKRSGLLAQQREKVMDDQYGLDFDNIGELPSPVSREISVTLLSLGAC